MKLSDRVLVAGMALWALATLGSLALGPGCCHTCPPPAPPVVIQEKVSSCLKKDPPVMPHMEWVTGAEKGCPDAWETCQTKAEAAKLFLYLTAVRTWQRDAWNACGALPKPTPPAAAK